MLHGLSRTTLNIIIFLCLLLISWIHLGGRDAEEQPLEALPLPELSPAGWNLWPNAEQVPVWLRAGGTLDGGRLQLRSQHGAQTLTLPAQNWLPALQQALPTLAQNVPAVMLISGPWPVGEQSLMAAFLIREQHLQPLAQAVNDWPDCLRAHPAGTLWLGQQFGLDWSVLAALPGTLASSPVPTLPTRAEWAQWRLEKSRQLRQQWQEEQGQIDIQATLAYHRLPADTYQLLYNALRDAQKTAPAALLACLNPPGP